MSIAKNELENFGLKIVKSLNLALHLLYSTIFFETKSHNKGLIKSCLFYG